MLKLDIKPGESVKIGDIAVITLEDKSGKVARLSIQADKSIPIQRTAPSPTAQIAAKVGLSGGAG
ncbi:carbon storage regulator [Burkholderia multivorans]|uniref:carbon storage regulator n=1 Tax=Burkholderia multivorans TaxID=87883 RepID=UPI001C24AFFA|nr:carbon storage regulator [Burkholderia multivorans]ULR75119.1 carbon storage regulator [Burkholderia phage JC1]MBU9386633.1 carbon storage regulator [Burkholderia multivorans]MBU9437067.1 carbon storage regulator [Burkholderia multivorans]MBU9606272.1 carbon storage regulator [Burkholderia multivorans]MBU9624831.1 carbon storage regulator [Burkholderia multivorans]